jgi:hypothetical protein
VNEFLEDWCREYGRRLKEALRRSSAGQWSLRDFIQIVSDPAKFRAVLEAKEQEDPKDQR